MILEAVKIRPVCDTCRSDPKGPYWSKGVWFYYLHRVFKCPTCKVKLPLLDDANTFYSKPVEETSKYGIKRSFTGFFLAKLDKRTKAYKELVR